MSSVIKINNLKKTYHQTEVEVHAINGVTLEFEREGNLLRLSVLQVPEKQRCSILSGDWMLPLRGVLLSEEPI